MPNAVEPPVESPRDLASAYDLLSDGDGGAWRPIAGGTDLMVQITGELGDPPDRVIDIWALDELRGISLVGEALVLGSATGTRTIPAAEFWTGYRQTARRDDELLLRVRIPFVPERIVRFRKVGTRRAQAISKVVMALAWRGDPGEPWSDVRLALGSVAPTTIRATKTEAVLERALPTRETADLAAGVLADELAPIDDVRSTADYRRAVAARVLHRLIRDEGSW